MSFEVSPEIYQDLVRYHRDLYAGVPVYSYERIYGKDDMIFLSTTLDGTVLLVCAYLLYRSFTHENVITFCSDVPGLEPLLDWVAFLMVISGLICVSFGITGLYS